MSKSLQRSWQWLELVWAPTQFLDLSFNLQMVSQELSKHVNMFTPFFCQSLRNMNGFHVYSNPPSIWSSAVGLETSDRAAILRHRATWARGVKVLSWHKGAWNLV